MMTYLSTQRTVKLTLLTCCAMLVVLLTTYATTVSFGVDTVQAHPNKKTLKAHSSDNPLRVVRYQGKGYNFLYDTSWRAAPDGQDGVRVSHGDTRLDVFVQHTTEPISALQFEFGTQASDDCRQTENIPSTAIIDEAIWNLARYICVAPAQGQSSDEIVTLEIRDAIAGTYYSMAVVGKRGALDKHAFKSIASFRFA